MSTHSHVDPILDAPIGVFIFQLPWLLDQQAVTIPQPHYMSATSSLMSSHNAPSLTQVHLTTSLVQRTLGMTHRQVLTACQCNALMEWSWSLLVLTFFHYHDCPSRLGVVINLMKLRHLCFPLENFVITICMLLFPTQRSSLLILRRSSLGQW